MLWPWLGPIVLTILGTILVSLGLTFSERKEIQAAWATKRCEIPILFTAFLYKPSYDTRSATEFAGDNFKFCLQEIAKEVGKVGFAPFFAILGQQSQILKGVAPMLNNMRGMLADRMKKFSQLMDEKYKTTAHITIQLTRVFQHFRFAMGRLNAIAIAAIYSGLSLNKLIVNTIKASIRVVLIVVGILAALCFLLFFVMAPLIPSIILPTIVAVGATAAAFGAAFEKPDTGPFCCDPHALVVLADGTKKPLYSIHIGDVLASSTGAPNRVQGLLYVDASAMPLVSICGVRMSESHRVLNEKTGEWVLAKDHPESVSVSAGTILERLICLNTTQHEVPLCATESSEKVLVSDWEEVSTEEGQRAWIDAVADALHASVDHYPTDVPLVNGESVQVFHMKEKKWIPVKNVRIGDTIRSGNISTKVIGIYYGEATMNQEGLSDGVWISSDKAFQADSKALGADSKALGAWRLAHPDKNPSLKPSLGRFLATESEEFTIKSGDTEYLVRDFTEIGASSLSSLYDMLSSYMKKESSC